MECNRDEAVRAKEIAERKFRESDMKEAKKFAVKAQNMFPELEGISEMLVALEIHIAAEEKWNGESNWYGVLGLTPLADDDSIKKQYRKLALQLHPDKNRSIGANGAFQLISQAWDLLSDKSMRTTYDKRCGRLFRPSPEGMQNGFYNFANTPPSSTKSSKTSNSRRRKNQQASDACKNNSEEPEELEEPLRLVKRLKESYFTQKRMYIPKDFSNGMRLHKKKWIRLEDWTGRKWKINISTRGGRPCSFCAGLIKFLEANGLKSGEILLFTHYMEDPEELIKVMRLKTRKGEKMLARAKHGGFIPRS